MRLFYVSILNLSNNNNFLNKKNGGLIANLKKLIIITINKLITNKSFYIKNN